MDKLRIIYSKSKEAAFLSHIDICKIFEQAFTRAGISISYNKEKKILKADISFADPLPIGFESIAEILEVVLEEKLDIPYFIKQMNKVLPSGITILTCEYVRLEEENLISRVYASTYLISFVYDEDELKDKTKKQIEEIKLWYKQKMKEYLEQEYLLVLKKTKNRMERIDIKPQIINYDFLLDGSLEVTICSGLRKNLRPECIMTGYNEYIDKELKYNIKRTKILYK